MRRKKAEITSTTLVILASSRRGHPPKVDRVFYILASSLCI